MNNSFELLEAFGLMSEVDIKPLMVSPKRELLSPIITTNNFQWNYDMNNNSIENSAQKPSLKRKRGLLFKNQSSLINRLPIDLPSSSIGIKIESSSSSIFKTSFSSSSTSAAIVPKSSGAADLGSSSSSLSSTSATHSPSLASTKATYTPSSSSITAIHPTSLLSTTAIHQASLLSTTAYIGSSWVNNTNELSSHANNSSTSSMTANINSTFSSSNESYASLLTMPIEPSSNQSYNLASGHTKSYSSNGLIQASTISLSEPSPSTSSNLPLFSLSDCKSYIYANCPMVILTNTNISSAQLPTPPITPPMQSPITKPSLPQSPLPMHSLSTSFQSPPPPPPPSPSTQIDLDSASDKSSKYKAKRAFYNFRERSKIVLKSTVETAKNKQLSSMCNPISTDTEQYPVSKVESHKDNDGCRFYLIKWYGWSNEHNSWVRESDCECPEKIAQYKRRYFRINKCTFF